MEWLAPLVSLLDDVPPLFKIIGLAFLVSGISLPLLKGAHPFYILIAFIATLGFLLIILSWIFEKPTPDDSTWLKDGLINCAIVQGLNPQGANNLAVRDGPNRENTEISQRYTGQKLWVHGQTTGWLNVRFMYRGEKVEGWVSRRYTQTSAC
ncbi:SH3 domain-containing protein [Ascidiaceihabitans sp.]|uniref:SH3 domain-containing protein n=1 Tax=Ascidiaceihabitans sp. TaxID=1872644 RepID=UPI003299D36B